MPTLIMSTPHASDRDLDPDALRRVARSLLSGDHATDQDADDLTQDVALKRLQGKGRNAYRPRGFWRQTMWNRANERRRALAREREVLEALPKQEAAPGTASRWHVEDTRRMIVEAVDELDEATSVVIRMRFWEGMKPGEIAEQLGIELSTVKSRLVRGKARLKETLERRVGGPEALRRSLVPVAGIGSATVRGGVIAAALLLAIIPAIVWGTFEWLGNPAELDGEGGGAPGARLSGSASPIAADPAETESNDEAVEKSRAPITTPFTPSEESVAPPSPERPDWNRQVRFRVHGADQRPVPQGGARLRIDVRPGIHGVLPTNPPSAPPPAPTESFLRTTEAEGLVVAEVPELACTVSAHVVNGDGHILLERHFPLRPGEALDERLEIPVLRSISGRLLHQQTQEPIEDMPIHVSIRSVSLPLRAEDVARPRTRTGPDGSFSLEDLPARSCVFTGFQNGLAATTMLDIEAHGPPTLDGVVWYADVIQRARLRVRSPAGQPVGGLSLVAYGHGLPGASMTPPAPGIIFMRPLGLWETDQEGLATLRYVGADPLVLELGRPSSHHETVQHRIEDPGALQDIVFERRAIRPAAEAMLHRWDGRLLDAEGRVIRRAEIDHDHGGGWITGGRIGRSWSRKVGGPKSVIIVKKGHAHHAVLVPDLATGEAGPLRGDVTLAPEREIVIRARDIAGRPIPSAKVRVWTGQTVDFQTLRTAEEIRNPTTDENGELRLRHFADQDLALQLIVAEEVVGSVQAAAGVRDVILQEGRFDRRHISLTGRVSVGEEARAAPDTRVQVEVRLAGSENQIYRRVMTEIRTDAGGRFRLEGLPTGEARVVIRHDTIPTWRGPWRTLSSGAHREDVNLAAAVPVRVRIVDPLGKPHREQSVVILRRNVGPLKQAPTLLTDDQGELIIRGLPGEARRLTLYLNVWTSEVLNLTIPATTPGPNEVLEVRSGLPAVTDWRRFRLRLDPKSLEGQSGSFSLRLVDVDNRSWVEEKVEDRNLSSGTFSMKRVRDAGRNWFEIDAVVPDRVMVLTVESDRFCPVRQRLEGLPAPDRRGAGPIDVDPPVIIDLRPR